MPENTFFAFVRLSGLCSILASIFLLTPSAPALSQSAPAASFAVSYDREAAVIEQSETNFKYQKDGTGEKDIRVRIKIQSEAGAREFSVLSFSYASASESAQIQSLTAHHTDGSTTETPATDAMDMPAPVTQQAPLYSDLKVLQIPVRGVVVGDILEYRVRIDRKNAESPSQFWENFSFIQKGAVVLAQSVTLDVPADKYVQVWSPDFKPAVTESAGRRVYVWTSNQLKPTMPDPNAQGPSSQDPAKPDIAWTTFHNWAEVGAWYRALAAPRAAPNDALRARADELTRDVKTPQDQIQALYSFVSTHVRYIGIDFGIGRYQPHPAAEVLANQYGDCKDKDTLLEALLLAKGFTSSPVLVGVNVAVIPDVPSPAFFNHVITTVNLPAETDWMDSTPGVSPFRLLVAPIRDKQSLVIRPDGKSALEKAPAEPPFPFTDRFEATATLSPAGELKGNVRINFRSDVEILIRLVAQNLAPSQWDQGTQSIANSLGFGGQTSNSSFGRADDTTVPMLVTYDYTRKPYGDWDNFRILALLPISDLPTPPEKEPTDDIDLGALRTDTAISRIHLPDGFGADLPDATHVKTAFATFDKTYRFENGSLIAERTIAVLQHKLPAASWETYAKFIKDSSLGEEAWVQLNTTHPTAAGPHPPQPGEDNPQASQLITDANGLEQSRNWTDAQQKLDEARKLNPEQPFLWSNYGYLAMVQKKPDEANEDFKHELAHHPEESFVVTLYAGLLFSRHEISEALDVLQASFDRDPSNRSVASMLARVQGLSRKDDAIKTLQRAIGASPKDDGLKTALGNLLVDAHRNAEAADIVKKVLLGNNDDAGLLNDASYVLAESNLELPLAEQKSRRSLEILDAETASAAIGEANQKTFARVSLLDASWDTLGDILYKENKLDEARDYIEAAWNNQHSLEVGLHYGQLLEALHQPKQALVVYQLARPRNPGAGVTSSAALPEIDANITRLEGPRADPKLSADPEFTFQKERTFKFALKSTTKGFISAVYRIQLASNTTLAVMRVSGDAPDYIPDSIIKLTLPHLVPAASKGRILRDAALSCSAGQSECFLVLMPMGAINAEQAGQ